MLSLQYPLQTWKNSLLYMPFQIVIIIVSKEKILHWFATPFISIENKNYSHLMMSWSEHHNPANIPSVLIIHIVGNYHWKSTKVLLFRTSAKPNLDKSCLHKCLRFQVTNHNFQISRLCDYATPSYCLWETLIMQTA